MRLKERTRFQASNVLKRLRSFRSFSLPRDLRFQLLLNFTGAYLIIVIVIVMVIVILIVIVMVVVIVVCVISYVRHHLSIYRSNKHAFAYLFAVAFKRFSCSFESC